MSKSGLIAGKPKLADSSYHIIIFLRPGKEIRVVRKGILLMSTLPITAPFAYYLQAPEHLQAAGKQRPALICMYFYCLYRGHMLLIYGTANGKATLWVMEGSVPARLLSFPKWATQTQSLGTSSLNIKHLAQLWLKVQEGMPLPQPRSWTF